jgi:hypothetical protein
MRRLILTAVLVAGLVLGVSAAQADTQDIIEPQHEPPTAADGWQAGTCEEDEPPPPAEPTVFCSPETKTRFYTQAGGHSPMGFTQYIIQHKVEGPLRPLIEPVTGRTLKTQHVDLPPGLINNPQSTGARCSLADFEHIGEIKTGVFGHVPACDPGTIVGRDEVTLVTNENEVEIAPSIKVPKGFVIPPSAASGTRVPVYNLEPHEGEPALFGFVVAFKELIFLETAVAWESDYHEAFTIHEPEPSHPFSALKNRLVTNGRAGDGTNLTNPTTCFAPTEFPHLYSTWFRAESWLEPDPAFPNSSTPVESKVEDSEGNLIQQTGCALVPFDPSLEAAPGTALVDSPSPATVTTKLPVIKGGETISESHLRSAKVTLPQGMGLNPSGANGLLACSDAQFGKGKRVEENTCPAASKIGTAEIETPPLPAGSLKGDVYVGEQKSVDPTSGEEFRTLVEAKSKQYGVVVRLIGNVSADPKTGQLTATFDEQEVGPLAGSLPHGLPQAPFESVTLRFDGAKSVLSSPPTCSAAQTTGAMEPWARPGTLASPPPTTSFTLTSIPGGGSCPTTMAARPFAPSYTAKSDSSKANAYSPFRVHIGRPDGQQELKVVDVTLPKGHAAKLKGIPYCSDAALAAAAANSGLVEKASPSCPSASMVGTASTLSGTGPNPLKIDGNAYLAGPYQGAPLSLAFITPAVAGPFDLGTVVVRVALFVNPETTQVHAVSSAIPDVFGGVKLDIRSIDINIDRPKFMHNPTNCSAQSIVGTINGGGADPTNPAAFSSYPVSVPFQATGCNKLGFKPKLFTRLLGDKGVTTRGKHPKLRAILEAREGDANLARSALNLPHALFLDQSHIRTVCTRPQLASQTCPKAAVYGHAEAKSPLLENKLKGPVYMVSSNHELPDLVADLRGQINVQLHGIISSVHGGIKTVFNPLPDAPVSKFILRMEGGKKGLLVNSRNLCKAPLSSVMNLKAQNGKKVLDNHLPLRVSGCTGHK